MNAKSFLKVVMLAGIVVCVGFLSGCEKKTPVSAVKPLEIIDVKIGIGDKQVDQFNASDKIKISYDVKNMFAINIGGKPYIWVRQDIMIRDSKNAIVLVRPAVLEIKRPVNQKPARFINEVSLSTIKNLKPGNFKIHIFLTDIVSFQTAKNIVPFVIK